jgi:putative transposase
MHEAKDDVLAFRHFPKEHWKKIWSTNLLELSDDNLVEGSRQTG